MAEAFEPMDAGFAAEPCSLAFGVVAVALLGLGHGLFASELAAKNGCCLSITQGGKWAAVWAVALDEALGLFDEASVKHGGSTLVDALVEQRSRRVEAESQDAIAGEGVAAFLPLLSKRLLCGERDFDGADDFGDVVGVNGRCGCCVEASEEAVNVGRSVRFGALAEAFAVSGVRGR